MRSTPALHLSTHLRCLIYWSTCVSPARLPASAVERPTVWRTPTCAGALKTCLQTRAQPACPAALLLQVHYGHSCLVPVDVTSLPCMYVFVDIKMDTEHFVASVR